MDSTITIYKDDFRFQSEVTRVFDGRGEESVTREQIEEAMWKWLAVAVDHLIEDASHYATGPRPIAGDAYREPYPVEHA